MKKRGGDVKWEETEKRRLARPARRAFFEERGDSFASGVRRPRTTMFEPTDADFVVAREKRGVEEAFGGREGTRFVREKTGDGGVDGRVKVVGGDERLNEPDVGGARSVEGRGGQNELLKRGERVFSA